MEFLTPLELFRILKLHPFTPPLRAGAGFTVTRSSSLLHFRGAASKEQVLRSHADKAMAKQTRLAREGLSAVPTAQAGKHWG